MTPYEYADLAQTSFANAMSSFTVILSIVTGYLVTMYVIGTKLTRFQAAILISIFLFVVGFLTWSMAAFAYWGAFYAAQGTNAEGIGMLLRPGAWVVVPVVILNSAAAAMCMLFTRSIRNS